MWHSPSSSVCTEAAAVCGGGSQVTLLSSLDKWERLSVADALEPANFKASGVCTAWLTRLGLVDGVRVLGY